MKDYPMQWVFHCGENMYGPMYFGEAIRLCDKLKVPHDRIYRLVSAEDAPKQGKIYDPNTLLIRFGGISITNNSVMQSSTFQSLIVDFRRWTLPVEDIYEVNSRKLLGGL